MGLDKDITKLKILLEDDFKGASREEVDDRRSEEIKLIRQKLVAWRKEHPNQTHPTGFKEGVCPLCGGTELDYKPSELYGEQYEERYTCLDCGSEGTEVSKIKFMVSEIDYISDDIDESINEDDFKGADDEEIEVRKAEEEERKEVKVKEWEEKNGRKIDTCPHCGVDLREEDVGVIAYETVNKAIYLSYDKNHEYDPWVWGDSDDNNSEITSYGCGKCYMEIRRGRDFDVEL